MSLHIFDNSQKIIKRMAKVDLIELSQELEINKADILEVEIPLDKWKELTSPPVYVAVNDSNHKFSYQLYKIVAESVGEQGTFLKCIQSGYDDLKAGGILENEIFTKAPVSQILGKIVEGTGWEVGYVDTDLGTSTHVFEYESPLSSLSQLLGATGAEVRFRTEVSGNKVTGKRIDLLKRLGEDKGIRFEYGSRLLKVVKESNVSELYTALIGLGKDVAEEGGSKELLTFEDVVWDKSKGDPLNKPKGQKYLEFPERTSIYGYPSGKPRKGKVEDSQIEDPVKLLKKTYETLLEVSRPQVQFKTEVLEGVDVDIGDTVGIIRGDLDIRYRTRVFKIKKNLLKDKVSMIEFGDKLISSVGERLGAIDLTISSEIDRTRNLIQTASNNKNKIFRGPDRPSTGMMLNDLWYKPVGDGETELYRWDGEMWKLEKVSAGILGGTLDADSGDLDVININANNISANRGNFISLALNELNSSLSVTGNRLRYTHSGGNYTELSADGLMKYHAGSKREYHHMTKIIKFSTSTSGNDGVNEVRWIPLGSEFNGLNWEVSLSVADSITAPSIRHSVQRIVLTQGHYGPSDVAVPRYRNGQWEYPVTGYTIFNHNSTGSQTKLGVSGLLIITA